MSQPARENPFRTDRVHSIPYRLPGGSLNELLDRFAALNCRAALVGPHGTGKTTLLEDLEALLENRTWSIRRIRLNSDKRELSDDEHALLRVRPPNSPLLFTIDGCEQLSYWRWRLVKRAIMRLQAGILITTHRPGRLATLHRHETTPVLLADIVEQVAGPRCAAELAELLPPLFATNNGNIRSCLRALYDHCAEGSRLR